jgi:hypothetical protein
MKGICLAVVLSLALVAPAMAGDTAYIGKNATVCKDESVLAYFMDLIEQNKDDAAIKVYKDAQASGKCLDMPEGTPIYVTVRGRTISQFKKVGEIDLFYTPTVTLK